MQHITLLYTPCSSEIEAKSIAKILVENNLIACANIFPITSVYKWEGKIEEGNEFVLMCKVLKEKNEETKNMIKNLHSYETPCILDIDSICNDQYFNWITST